MMMANGTESADGTARRQTRIHRLIEDQVVVLIPGCHDALSAAIVEKTGFSAGIISGSALSASLLGKPDIGLLTQPEMAETTRLICAAAPHIPFIADADTGGGNALNVQRTVKDLIAAGAAGCFLEDQEWPKKCGRCLKPFSSNYYSSFVSIIKVNGHMPGKKVIPADEHAAKNSSCKRSYWGFRLFSWWLGPMPDLLMVSQKPFRGLIFTWRRDTHSYEDCLSRSKSKRKGYHNRQTAAVTNSSGPSPDSSSSTLTAADVETIVTQVLLCTNLHSSALSTTLRFADGKNHWDLP
ncbi:phosphoenolpyruvate carboxylase family protein [Actinidia rufa]|uniref:Phosphoenolpyruvate carboxylase family protein n=1 Tax=Actinidia rufa TaxID=165716 RepID=A0A7J0DLS5_9ERIC|nr:phosphoenolpyruvate carboxylase family protein [Actinidia rufa]